MRKWFWIKSGCEEAPQVVPAWALVKTMSELCHKLGWDLNGRGKDAKLEQRMFPHGCTCRLQLRQWKSQQYSLYKTSNLPPCYIGALSFESWCAEELYRIYMKAFWKDQKTVDHAKEEQRMFPHGCAPPHSNRSSHTDAKAVTAMQNLTHNSINLKPAELWKADDLMCKRWIQLSGRLRFPSHCNNGPFKAGAQLIPRPLSVQEPLPNHHLEAT